MWKFLGQKSFPLSEKRYMEQLDAVRSYSSFTDHTNNVQPTCN